MTRAITTSRRSCPMSIGEDTGDMTPPTLLGLRIQARAAHRLQHFHLLEARPYNSSLFRMRTERTRCAERRTVGMERLARNSNRRSPRSRRDKTGRLEIGEDAYDAECECASLQACGRVRTVDSSADPQLASARVTSQVEDVRNRRDDLRRRVDGMHIRGRCTSLS